MRRVFTRILLWRCVIQCFRGLTLLSYVNLFVSAFVDVLSSFFIRLGNPTLIFSGIYLSSEGLILYVRGRTEDLYHLTPRREGEVDLLVRHMLRSGDIFVDVGANVGYYTLLAANRGCRVIAIEPIPQTVAILKINLRLNRLEDRVTIIDKCAWETRTNVKFVIPQGKFFGLASALLSNSEGTMAEIECIDLDSILHDQSHVRMIKIDVEGAEYEVLKGANNTLSKTDFIVIELSRNVKEVISFLTKKGYNLKRLGFTTYILAYNTVNIKIKRRKDE